MKGIFTTITMISLTLLLVACHQRPEVAKVGKQAPNFTLVDTKGRTWKLDELKGQVVFLNFWATWCPPCREEMPSMQRVYASMQDDQFKMLAVLSNDDPSIADAMAARIGATFPILVDPESKVAKAYGLTGVPETHIIDKQGVIRKTFIGSVRWDSAEVMQMLTNLIASDRFAE